MKREIIRCSECVYCEKYRKFGNTRTEFSCGHPDREYIREYYEKHHIFRLWGFIGHGKPYSEEVPLKTSPAWCPKKKA